MDCFSVILLRGNDERRVRRGASGFVRTALWWGAAQPVELFEPLTTVMLRVCKALRLPGSHTLKFCAKCCHSTSMAVDCDLMGGASATLVHDGASRLLRSANC